MSKKLSLAALAIAILALVISTYPYFEHWSDGGAPLPTPVVGKKVTILERHFNRRDPGFSQVTVDEIKILTTDNERTTAKTKLGYEVTSSYNFFLPSFEEKSTDPKNLYLERNTVFGDTLSFFPLKIGKKSSNRVVGDTTQSGGSAWEYVYNCEVMGKEKVQIPLGTFDTYKVVCTATGTKNYKKTFFYDPKMEQLLLVERDDEHPYYSQFVEAVNP